MKKRIEILKEDNKKLLEGLDILKKQLKAKELELVEEKKSFDYIATLLARESYYNHLKEQELNKDD